MDNSIKVAVVTGGHRFDVPNFHGLFRKLEGVDAYIQSLEDFASPRSRGARFLRCGCVLQYAQGRSDR